MGLSRELKQKIEAFSADEIDRLIRMGWEDRTSFDAIKKQFGLSEDEFVKLMRTQLSPTAFARWRKRAHEQGKLKHEKKQGIKSSRFKCSRQSDDGITKGWK